MADKPTAPTLASLTQHILNETLYSIIHNIVLETHSAETALRRTCDPKTQLPLCPSCGLPRLLEPPLASSRPDKTTQYCSHAPWSRRAGHDIYGNPFPVAGSDKPPTKKEREARAKAEQKRKDSTVKDEDEDGGPNIAGGPVDKKAAKVGERLKGGTYVPWHTCPSCKRSLLITRFAQHLEKCLGIGGRGRAAARNGTGTNGTGSQGSGVGGSRGGTPVGAKEKREEDSEDEDAGMRKKVLKKGLIKIKDKEGKLSAPKDGKVSKMLKLSTAMSSAGGTDSDAKSAKEKRPRPLPDDDEEEEDATPLRKKMKLQRQLSLASVVSSVTAPGSAGGEDAEGESADGDGSFVDQDENEEDDD
ncbi:hypothetical protein ANO11243_076910 [Dothideomycetidae sp. 11243]|nr:hypothetical protein ANO11243_076910 [fungal sp. No.11243]